MKAIDFKSNSIAGPYPRTGGYSYGEVLECTNTEIKLKDGRIFEFPFPSEGLRQKPISGTQLQLKLSPSGMLKEYMVILTPKEVERVKREVESTI